MKRNTALISQRTKLPTNFIYISPIHFALFVAFGLCLSMRPHACSNRLPVNTRNVQGLFPAYRLHVFVELCYPGMQASR